MFVVQLLDDGDGEDVESGDEFKEIMTFELGNVAKSEWQLVHPTNPFIRPFLDQLLQMPTMLDILAIGEES